MARLVQIIREIVTEHDTDQDLKEAVRELRTTLKERQAARARARVYKAAAKLTEIEQQALRTIEQKPKAIVNLDVHDALCHAGLILESGHITNLGRLVNQWLKLNMGGK